MKRTNKSTERTKPLQLESTTIKVLTDRDFTLINGGSNKHVTAIKSSFCK